jgi:Suppressor of fused protein (SUFU)
MRLRRQFNYLYLLLALTVSGGSMCKADSVESRYISELQRHYERFWGESSGVAHWARGPIHELPKSFGVAVFPPRAGRSYWVYATLGMSLGYKESLELHLFSPRQADGLVELLTVVAHYHRTGAKLGLHHTVNFGRPWLKNSTCSYGLISLPYLYGSQLEWLGSSGLRVRNLWLLPITKAERDFKKKNGAEALERLFEEHQVDYLDPERRSLVEKGGA